MKHAFLIMAKSIDEELITLVRSLDAPNHVCFVHVDKKSSSFELRKKALYAAASQVVVVPRISVTWGGFSQVKAELLLLRESAKHDHFDFYHLLSGEDFPVKSNAYIDDFFNKHPNENFIEVSDRIPKENEDRFALRYQQYHLLQDRFIGKKRNLFKYLDFLSCYIQRYIGINRAKKISVQSGANWFSITDKLARYVLTKENWIEKHFKNTYCPDEAFLQSLIANSPFMDTLFQDGNANLRYVNFYWKAKHEKTPRYLTVKDDWLVNDARYLFARKFSPEVAQKFLQKEL